MFRGLARLVYRERGNFRTIENMGVRPLGTPVTRDSVRFEDARFVTCSFDANPTGRAEIERLLNMSSDVLSWEISRPDAEKDLARFKVHRREKLKPFTAAMKLEEEPFDPEDPR